MSETINYHLTAEGFKNVEELDDLINLCYAWNMGDEDEYANTKNLTLEFSFINGSRGGARSCEEIIKQHFEEWFEEHPHVSFSWDCVYIDQAPIITEWSREV